MQTICQCEGWVGGGKIEMDGERDGMSSSLTITERCPDIPWCVVKGCSWTMFETGRILEMGHEPGVLTFEGAFVGPTWLGRSLGLIQC